MKIIKIKGYLNNKTNNDITIIDTTAKKINNKYIYTIDNTKYELIIETNNIYIIRENNDIKSIMNFVKDKHTICDYTIKKDDINLQIELKTIKMLVDSTRILINYKVENMDIYEFLVEIED